MSALVGVIMGSKSDWPTMKNAIDMLEEFGVPYEVKVVSAHRTPDLMFEYAETAQERGLEVIIAGAGGSAHLPGMVAAKTIVPVLGDFPNDVIILNGEVDSIDKIQTHLKKVDGVMIGRAAYHSPYFLAEVEKEIFNNYNIPTRAEIMEKMIPYIKEETNKGTRLNQIMRHTIGLFHGQKGSTRWKRYLSTNMCIREADLQKVNHIMDHIKNNSKTTSLGR